MGGQKLTYGATSSLPLGETFAASVGAPMSIEGTAPVRNTFFYGGMPLIAPKVGQDTISVDGADFLALTTVTNYYLDQRFESYFLQDGELESWVPQHPADHNAWMETVDFDGLYAKSEVLDSSDYPMPIPEVSGARCYIVVEEDQISGGGGPMTVIGGVSSTGALTSYATHSVLLPADGSAYDLIW